MSSRQTDVEENLNTTIIGSLNYMAPELKKCKKYNIKSDIWSLGVIFYELCLLKHPFADDDIHHVPTTIPDIDYKQLQYPEYFEKLYKMMVQIQPFRRQSVKDILSLPQFADAVHQLYLGN
jgi:serine/threonine protein kinase